MADKRTVALGARYDAFEKLVVTENIVGFTAVTLGDRTYAFITCEGSIRFRIDGGDPSGADGHELDDGDPLLLDRVDQVVKFRAVSVGGKDATLQCSFGR